MGMRFGCDPQIIFSHFFRNLNLVIFCATPTILAGSFLNFAGVFVKSEDVHEVWL